MIWVKKIWLNHILRIRNKSHLSKGPKCPIFKAERTRYYMIFWTEMTQNWNDQARWAYLTFMHEYEDDRQLSKTLRVQAFKSYGCGKCLLIWGNKWLSSYFKYCFTTAWSDFPFLLLIKLSVINLIGKRSNHKWILKMLGTTVHWQKSWVRDSYGGLIVEMKDRCLFARHIWYNSYLYRAEDHTKPTIN